MYPVRPEGGGRPPQVQKPTAPDITEILRVKEPEPLTEEERKKKARTLALLIALSLAFAVLAIFLTVKVIKILPTLA